MISTGVFRKSGSVYDVRDLFSSMVHLRDGRPITDMKLDLKQKIALKKILERIEGTEVEKLIKRYHVI